MVDTEGLLRKGASVYAEIGCFFGAGSVDDAGIITLEMEGGGIGEGIADGAFATIDPSWSRGDGFPAWGGLTLLVTGSEDPNALMIEDFLRGAEGGRIGADSRDGLRTLEVVLAAYRSDESHAPVAIERAKR
ncbi:MAG: hypothetical protein H0U04_03790 [Rubrobacter sp.]|nr:hypothetical protein [Rubrobacter sp.]